MLLLFMNLKTIFKRFVILDLILLLLLIVSVFLESEEISYINQSFSQPTDMMLFLSVFVAVVWLVSLYYLYNFKKNGRELYFFAIVFSLFLSLLMGDIASSATSYVLDGLGWANSGAILTLLYFSPIKKEFGK